ncbi:MAG: MaoC family dehydratase N-terminal domain-containing protein [Acidimicrobiia bacterium]
MTGANPESLIGREGEPFALAVETGKIREFARATKSRNAAYSVSENAVSPVTFLMTADHWMTKVNLPWGDHQRNLARVLHAEQEFVFHGEPPRAGDVLTGRCRIEKAFDKEGKRGGTLSFAVLLWEYWNASGRLVAEVRFTQVETKKAPKADGNG